VGDASLLVTSPVALIAAAIFGALWGSFFNVCIARVPRGESVVRPPSHCFACGRTVRPWDNIPLVSYFVLRGRCRFCRARFSSRYVLIEALAALLSVLLYWRFVMGEPDAALGVLVARYAVYFVFTGVLLVLSFIDLDTKRLPDVITLPAIPLLFLATFATHTVPWLPRAIGVVAGYGLVRLIADGYYYLTGREGLGLGDGKLLAVVGAVLGWKAILAVIFMGSFLGIVVSVPLLLAGRQRARAGAPPPAPEAGGLPDAVADGAARDEEDTLAVPVRHTQVPFGPFLSLSAVIYLLCGDALWGWLVSRLEG
jgi:leader peptidase (prepilin peptidase)/N-methyltransferase